MQIIPYELNGFTTPSYNGKAVLHIDTGPTFHEIKIRTNLTAAQISYLNLKLSGDTIVRVKGSDLVMIERYRKVYETAGSDGTGTDPLNVFVLNLADIANLGVESRNFTALVTMAGESLILELEIGAPLGGAPAITLKASAEVSAAQPHRRWLPKIYRTAINAAQTNDNVWSTLERGPYIRRIHFEQPLTRLEVKKDDATVYKIDAFMNEAHLKRNVRAPQPGYYHFDAIASDFGFMDMFDTHVARSLQFVFGVTAPVNVEALVECVIDNGPAA